MKRLEFDIFAEQGATTIEYIVLVSLIIFGTIGAVAGITPAISNTFKLAGGATVSTMSNPDDTTQCEPFCGLNVGDPTDPPPDPSAPGATGRP